MPGDEQLHSFDYLLAETPGRQHTEEALLLQETHDIVEFVDCFSNIGLQPRAGFPVKIKTKPCLWIMRRNRAAPAASASSLIGLRERVRTRINAQAAGGGRPNDTQTETTAADDDTNGAEPATVERSSAPEIDNERIVAAAATKRKPNETRTPRRPEPEAAADAAPPPPAAAQPTPRKQSAMRAKLKEIIVSHYRSKGRVVESEPAPGNAEPMPMPAKPSMKSNIKRIIRAEQIREMVEQMATIDLNSACDLERMSTKECLHKLIDDQDTDAA